MLWMASKWCTSSSGSSKSCHREKVMSYKRPQKCLDGSRWSSTNPKWSWGFLMCADLDQMAQNMSRWVQRWSLTVLKCSWCVPMVAEWYLINKFSFIFCWWVSNGIERLWKIEGLFSIYQNLVRDTPKYEVLIDAYAYVNFLKVEVQKLKSSKVKQLEVKKKLNHKS